MPRIGLLTWLLGAIACSTPTSGPVAPTGRSLPLHELHNRACAAGKATLPSGAPVNSFKVNGHPVVADDGQFHLCWGETGRFELELRAHGLGVVRTQADVVLNQVRFIPDLKVGVGRTIRGQVLDVVSGRPISEAVVVVGPFLANDDEFATFAKTDELGRFELPYVCSGEVVLDAVHPHHAWGHATLAANESQVTFRLEPGGVVEGQVASDKGPIEGEMSISWLNPDGHRLGPIQRVTWTARTDPNGRYRFDGLNPGRYLVGLAQRSDVAPNDVGGLPKPFQIDGPETRVEDFTIHAGGSLQILVNDHFGASHEAVGLLMGTVSPDLSPGEVDALVEGAFWPVEDKWVPTFSGLSPGTYSAFVIAHRPNGRFVFVREVQIEGAEHASVELTPPENLSGIALRLPKLWIAH